MESLAPALVVVAGLAVVLGFLVMIAIIVWMLTR